MFQKLILSLGLAVAAFSSFAQDMTTVFERSGGLRSATYRQTISYYQALDKRYETIKMEAAGPTDTKHPLHVVYYSADARFGIDAWKKSGKLIILINNGIHPGEPDGIEASMMLMREAANGKIKIPQNLVLAVVPALNIGGMLNRGSYSRANQNGPEEYGFRGSAQNLDLNRDFMKLDAKETRSLIKLFHRLDPDLFIDNHVSNGADYQHIMTLLTTEYNKLGGAMGKYLHESLEPAIYKDMAAKGYNLVPYVNHWGHNPAGGWEAFYEGPRFASGWAALFQTYAFVPETHMLKSFKQRVAATYALMNSFINIAAKETKQIRTTRQQDRKAIAKQQRFTIAWQLDTSRKEYIRFDGYEAGYKPSEVSGKPRLYYDRDRPYTKEIPYYNSYMAKQQIKAPEAYFIPQGWTRAINRLKWNNVAMHRLERDTVMHLTVSYIVDYQTVPKPYEGHYLHHQVTTRDTLMAVHMLAGDYIIPLNQQAKRYLIEALEPTAPDGFFAWGFFDAILQQKEYYSDYVFEDEAAAILKDNPELQQKLEAHRQADSSFANNGRAQLHFVYRHSRYYEPGHMRYPVFRLYQ